MQLAKIYNATFMQQCDQKPNSIQAGFFMSNKVAALASL